MADADQITPPRPAAAPLSIMALAAVIVAIIPCCPFFGLIGGILGFFAVRRIERATPRLRGRRLAIAAMLLGPICSIIWLVGVRHLATWQDAVLREAIGDRVTEALTAADGQRARAAFATDIRPAAAAMESAVADFKQRYGTIRSVSISNMEISGFPPSRIEAAMLLDTEQGATLSSGIFDMYPTGTSIVPTVVIRRLIVEDHDLGTITLPAPTESSTP